MSQEDCRPRADPAICVAVSVVTEKVKDLQAKFAPLGLSVRGYHAQADNSGELRLTLL